MSGPLAYRRRERERERCSEAARLYITNDASYTCITLSYKHVSMRINICTQNVAKEIHALSNNLLRACVSFRHSHVNMYVSICILTPPRFSCTATRCVSCIRRWVGDKLTAWRRRRRCVYKNARTRALRLFLGEADLHEPKIATWSLVLEHTLRLSLNYSPDFE